MSTFKTMCTVAWTELVSALRADQYTIADKAGPHTRQWIEGMVTAAITEPMPPDPRNWPSFDTAPKTGEFLVYMPDEKRKVQVMHRSGVDLIGDTFAFDRKTPARWHPLPPLPE